MKDTPESEIRGLIEAEGSICFAEFMQVALYHRYGRLLHERSGHRSRGRLFHQPLQRTLCFGRSSPFSFIACGSCWTARLPLM